ncbi:MAG: DUF5700 domain-containing putative Zn-dependent protease [Ferruginibacter sp.]
MNQLFKSLIAFTFLVNFSLFGIAQKVDTSPLDAYWKLIEPLKRGDSLSVSDWKNFLQIESNQIYVENQGFDKEYIERLRKAIQVVYMPKYDSILQVRLVAINKDPTSYWLTYKVYVYKAYEIELKKYETKIIQPYYLDSIYKNAFNWLPAKLQKKDSSVSIHFLGIENDAIAGGGIIIATLWSAYNQDKLKMGILNGHEMHHVLRKEIEFRNVAENDKGIMYVLNNILNEGTADMIDKSYDIAHDDELPIGCRFKDFELFQADSIVKQIDTSIIKMEKSQGKIYKTEKDYRNLLRWTSGHCPGYYMTDIIVRNGFKKHLLKNIQNPFYFIYLYNRAAKKDSKKPPIFTKSSVNYIKLLEQKYWLSK